MDKAKCVVCKKPSKFTSNRLSAAFCSDEHYEQFQRGDDPSKPHLIFFRAQKDDKGEVTRPAGAFFEQGDIRFPIDIQDLDVVLGAGSHSYEPSVIEKLMDSQVVSLATMNGLPIQPYVRHLITRPLHGIIQLVWYRDLKHNVDFDHLTKNQEQRVKDYIRLLGEYKPSEDGDGEGRRRRGASSKNWAGTYEALPLKNGSKAPAGREGQLYRCLYDSENHQASMSQLVEKKPIKSKQDQAKMVNRFLKQLVSDGFVKEVQ